MKPSLSVSRRATKAGLAPGKKPSASLNKQESLRQMIALFLSDGVRQIDEEDPEGVENEPPQPPPVAATAPPRPIRRRTEVSSGPPLPTRSPGRAPESSENEANEYERRTKALV